MMRSLVALACVLAVANAAKKPHVLFIVIDDLGFTGKLAHYETHRRLTVCPVDQMWASGHTKSKRRRLMRGRKMVLFLINTTFR
jgi:hypothetical protein